MVSAIKGLLVATTSSIIFALLFAYLFRLPIPLGGMIGPFGDFSPYSSNVFDVLKSVTIAWVFYGVFGGFIVIPIFGVIAGFVADKKNTDSNQKNKAIVLWAIVAGGIPVLFVSTLDYIIGPW